MSLITKHSNAVLRQCANRPWYTASLLLLSIVVILGGPLACIVHCLLLDVEHHAGHHHHDHHSAVVSGLIDDCPVVLSDDDQQLREAPSALTIAIVLPLIIVPLLFGKKLRLLTLSSQPVSTAHPPPRDPPRNSFCFA